MGVSPRDVEKYLKIIWIIAVNENQQTLHTSVQKQLAIPINSHISKIKIRPGFELSTDRIRGFSSALSSKRLSRIPNETCDNNEQTAIHDKKDNTINQPHFIPKLNKTRRGLRKKLSQNGNFSNKK